MKAASPVTRVIVLGAARSGTKILRDSLGAATGAGTVPYDVPFVWRYGASAAADDRLDPASLTSDARAFIARYIDRYAGGDPPCVIEKTVGNTLRVPYVARVFPDAKFVHLIRDGVDVAESTWRQWREPADRRYLMAKVRHFPLRMLPTYGARYAGSVLRRRLAVDQRVGTWGPRYPGMDEDLRRETLLTVCARQWRESVTMARRDLMALPAIEVRYEDFVSDPKHELDRVARFCGLPAESHALETAAGMVNSGRRGAGARVLTDDQLSQLEVEMSELLLELGYELPTGQRKEHWEGGTDGS